MGALNQATCFLDGAKWYFLRLLLLVYKIPSYLLSVILFGLSQSLKRRDHYLILFWRYPYMLSTLEHFEEFSQIYNSIDLSIQ